MREEANRYLFHWLPPEKLEAFRAEGILNPAWTHWILEEGRFVKGISTADEPMAWSPDEGMAREPCLVLDRTRIAHPIHSIDSTECYYLTKEIRRLKREKGDVAKAIEKRWKIREWSRCRPDESFIEGSITWDAVVLIGFEDDGRPSTAKIAAAARNVAEACGLGILDMSGWEIGYPGLRETDGIVEEAVNAAALSRGSAITG